MSLPKVLQEAPGQHIWALLAQAAHNLLELSCMAEAATWPTDLACQAMDSLLKAWSELQMLKPGVFRVRPKWHLLAHLVAEVAPRHGPPSLYWCYQDEDWGGKAVQAARRRGGANNPAAIAESTMARLLTLLAWD